MKRTLIIAPNWLGDCLMAQPLLTRLKARQPSIDIDVLAVPAVAPVFRRMPEVTAVLEEDFRHGQLGLGRRWRLGRALRGHYSQAFVLPNSWKSALLPFFADVPLRVGYAGESRFGLVNVLHRNPESTAPREPMARFYAQLAETPGRKITGEIAQPVLPVDPLSVIAAKVALGLKPVERLVALCPGAEYGPAKRWPAAHFAETAARLKAAGMTPIVLGTQKDVPIGLSIEQLSHGAALNLAGRTTLDEAMDLIAGSSMVVTNDSGLMHVAAALGRPQVALFGSSSPEHTPPLSDAAIVIYKHLACSPCFARECPLGHLNCLTGISATEVMEAIERAR